MLLNRVTDSCNVLVSRIPALVSSVKYKEQRLPLLVFTNSSSRSGLFLV